MPDKWPLKKNTIPNDAPGDDPNFRETHQRQYLVQRPTQAGQTVEKHGRESPSNPSSTSGAPHARFRAATDTNQPGAKVTAA